jgi:hypothetical protein
MAPVKIHIPGRAGLSPQDKKARLAEAVRYHWNLVTAARQAKPRPSAGDLGKRLQAGRKF